MNAHASVTDPSPEWKKKLGGSCLVALLLLASAFFLGSWVESRLDAEVRRHDALIAATLAEHAPDTLDAALSVLQSGDDALEARGQALLQEKNYDPPEPHTGARAIFTAFMLAVMLLRGAKLVFSTRRMFRHVRGASQKASSQITGLMRATPSDSQVPLRQALGELSEVLSRPLRSARTFTDVVLQKGVDAHKYAEFCAKLQAQLDKTEDTLALLTRLSSLQADLDQTLDLNLYPLSSLLQATEALASPALAERGLAISIAEAPPVCLETDHVFLPQALSHLMLSCGAFRQPGSAVTLAATPHGKQLYIDIACQGAHAPVRSRLLRFATRKIQPSTLDLAVADSILRALGGTLEERSVSRQAACYRVVLPLFLL